MSPTMSIFSDKYAKDIKPVFSSQEEFIKVRDEFIANLKPEIDKLNEKRRRSEEAAQLKRYR